MICNSKEGIHIMSSRQMKSLVGLLAIIAVLFVSSMFFNCSNPISPIFKYTPTGLGHWKAVNNGLTDFLYVHCIAVSGSSIYAGASKGSDHGGAVFLSTDNGTNWTPVDSGLPYKPVMALTVSGSNIFTVLLDSGIFLSTDNGASWIEANSGLPRHVDYRGDTNISVQALAVSGNSIFAATYPGDVFRSTDNGKNWTAANNGFTDSLYVKCIAVCGNNIFAGADNNYSTGGFIFVSNNNGSSWTKVGSTNTSISSLEVTGSNIFAGVDNGGLYLSTNNGLTWNSVNSTGLPQNCKKADNLTVSGIDIFGTPGVAGVYLSTNNGTSWTAFNNGLINPDVNALVVSGSNIFAGSSGGGVFVSPLP